MRRLGCLFLVLVLVLISTGVVSAEGEPTLPAEAYLLMDATGGHVLYAENGHEQLPIASITKIMTATLALERGNLSDIVTASQAASDTGGSTIYLEVGEQQTLENLLYALLLESANDVAVAIAEHIGGTEANFVDMMNQKAQEIGAKDTHFANSHGLDEPTHYSTAYDMALIARYAMQNQKFREIVATEAKEIPGFGQNPPRELHSHDQLLGYYDGAIGVKNGYTDAALQTNVAMAKRGDTALIAVVLGARDRVWSSSMALLDYGFSHYKTQPLVKKGAQVEVATLPGAASPLPAVAAADMAATVDLSGGTPEQKVVWDDGLKLPLAAGAHLGLLQEVQDGKPVGQVDLIAAVSAAATPTAKPAHSARVGDGLVLMLRWMAGAVILVILITWRFGQRRKRT